MTEPIGMIARTVLFFITLVLLATGCRVGPDQCRPEVALPTTWHQERDFSRIASEDVRRWWNAFDDPVMSGLIDLAIKNNRDAYQAILRIKQSRARVRIVSADKAPTLTAAGSLNHQQLSESVVQSVLPGFRVSPFDLWSVSTDVAWEADLFGRVTRKIEAANASYNISVESFRGIQISIIAETAKTYVKVRTLQEQLSSAKRNLALQEEAAQLAHSRVDAGVASDVDMHQATSELWLTRSSIPTLETNLHQALNGLAVLLGEYPGSLHESLTESAAIPTVPKALAVTLPHDMVRMRPDVRQAEQTIAQRVAEVGVAVADLYPRFAIAGSFGFSALQFGELFNGDAWTHNIGPSFKWPILQAGRIRNNIQRTEFAVEEAIAKYEQTLLTANTEVENALVGFAKERKRFEALSNSAASTEKAVESVITLYEVGKTDFRNVLETQRALLQVQNELILSRGKAAAFAIALYKALGGGWDWDDHCENQPRRLDCPMRVPPAVIEQTEPQSWLDEFQHREFAATVLPNTD